MFAHTKAFGSQFASYGQIGLPLDRLQATFCPLRRSPQLDLLAIFAAKARSTPLSRLSLRSDAYAPGKTLCKCRRFDSLHGQEVVLQTIVYRNKSDHSECNAS